MKKILPIILFFVSLNSFGQIVKNTQIEKAPVTRQGNKIGYLLNKTSLIDTSGLTCGVVGSSTYTISGSKLVVVQSTADYSYVRYDSVTSLDVINLDAVVSFNALAGDTYVAQFGIFEPGFPFGLRYSIYGTLSTRTDNGTLGRLYITSRDATAAPTTLATSASDLSMSTGDSIQVKFDKFENVVTFSTRNLTTNSAWVTVTYTLTGTQTSHSVGNIGIITGKENYNIHQFKVSSKQVKNPDLYLFGNSKFTKSTFQNESLVSLLKNTYGNVYANCAVGSTSADLVLNRWEVINLVRPTKVLIESSNDIRFGVSSGTWQANLTTLYDDFTANGIEVYFTCLYETGADQAAMDTWLTANYSGNYIRSPYVELQKYGSGILVDGIHLSAIGNKIVADALTLDGRLEVASTTGATQLTDFTTESAWTTGYINGTSDYTPLALGASGKVLTSNGTSSAPTWETPAASTAWNNINNPTGAQALTFQAGETTTHTDENTASSYWKVNNATSTTSSIFSLNRTSTALTSSGNNIMELISSGTNAVDATATALNILVTNTHATLGSNYGITVSASGAPINNVAFYASSGRVSIGDPSPQAMLQVGPDGGTSTAFGSAAQLTVANGGSATYMNMLGPSGTEGFMGVESAKIIFGSISNDPLIFRSNNTERINVATTGQIKFNNYGSGTFTGTYTKFLAVTSAGLIIEEDAPGGVTSLSALTDANISSPSNLQFLQYQTSDNKWHNHALASGDIPDISATYQTVANLSTTTSLGTSNTLYPSQNAVKTYVDNTASTITPKAAVRVATTASGTLASSFENGDAIDGITLATNDRILIKNQASTSENGIYTVNASGSPTRATDFDAAGEIPVGAETFIQSGTVNSGRKYTQTSTVVTLNTDPITFVQTGGASGVAWGAITGTLSDQTDLQSALDGKQASDADLTTIAGLTATTDNFMVSVASAWASRTPSQVRTTLGLVIGTNVQAWDTDLDTWAGKTPYAGSLVITTGKTVTFDHTSTFTTTDAQTYTFPTTTATIARTDAANTFTGNQTFDQTGLLLKGGDANTVNLKVNETETAARVLNLKVNNADRTIDLTGNLTLAGNLTTTGSFNTTFAVTGSNTITFPNAAITVARSDAAQTFTGTQTFTQVITTNNAITAVANAATVPITSALSTVTNNSAATLTITMTTTSAVDGQISTVRILDFSGVAQTITWVNTENSSIAIPTTSNGSTTLFLTVRLMYNSATSKWRCIGFA